MHRGTESGLICREKAASDTCHPAYDEKSHGATTRQIAYMDLLGTNDIDRMAQDSSYILLSLAAIFRHVVFSYVIFLYLLPRFDGDMDGTEH